MSVNWTAVVTAQLHCYRTVLYAFQDTKWDDWATGERFAYSLHELTIASVCQCAGSIMSSLSVLPPECLLQPFIVPKRLMLGPGPSNVPARISAAGAQPMLGHLHAETIEVIQYMCSLIYRLLTFYAFTFIQ